MRALLSPSLLVAAGCLSAPTGRDPALVDAPTGPDAMIDASANAWPPTAADIVAIGAGDLDGDGLDDVFALDAGTARVYLLRGGTDLDPTRPAVTSASDSAPLADLRAPAAVIVARDGSTPYVVVFDNPAAGPRFTVYDSALDMVSQTNAGSTPAAVGQAVSLIQTTFGMSDAAIFASIPDEVFFFEDDQLDEASPNVLALPQTGATPLASVTAIAGYRVPGAPSEPTVVVSELTSGQKAISTGPGNFTWSTVRATGAEWTAQAVADVTGDTYSDIVGFAPNGGSSADICVLDAQSGTSPCAATPFGMDTATIAVGPVVAAGQRDVVLIHEMPPGTMTSVFVVPRLRLSGTLMVDTIAQPTNVAVTDAMLALAQLDAAGKEIIVMGRDGTVVCARSTGSAPPVACAP